MSETPSVPNSAAGISNPVVEPVTLPSTLGDLLRAAITDARSLDKRAYLPYSVNWHFASKHGPCEVCLAGCLIAGRLRNSPSQHFCPGHFPNDIKHKLRAVDCMRRGDWHSAYAFLYEPLDDNDPLVTRLQQVPHHDHSNFYGWRRFEKHLASLESLLPSLEEIDRIAADRKRPA